MKAIKDYYYLDYRVQQYLLLGILCSIPLFIFKSSFIPTITLMVILCFWQTMSSLIHWRINRSKIHSEYLLWFFLLYFPFSLLIYFFGLLEIIIISSLLSFLYIGYYLKLTKRIHDQFHKKNKLNPFDDPFNHLIEE